MKNCGEITSIGNHHSSRNHVSVTVAHGARKKATGAGRKAMGSDYDDRPTSTFVIHKKHAGKYKVGQNVNVGITPTDGKPEELF